MTSKWAEGIQPRGFRWIITDHLGVCERPGGYGAAHRRVRRVEEIIWLARNEIDLVVTLTVIPYNLHDYDEHELSYVHLPYPEPSAGAARLEQIFEAIRDRVATDRVVLHHDAIADPLAGVVAGYLLWAGLVDSGPEAISITERLLGRELGPPARETVNLAERLKGPAPKLM